MSTLDYYRQQNPITDPGEFAWIYDDLPDDIAELYLLAQSLIAHPEDMPLEVALDVVAEQ